MSPVTKFESGLQSLHVVKDDRRQHRPQHSRKEINWNSKKVLWFQALFPSVSQNAL